MIFYRNLWYSPLIHFLDYSSSEFLILLQYGLEIFWYHTVELHFLDKLLMFTAMILERPEDFRVVQQGYCRTYNWLLSCTWIEIEHQWHNSLGVNSRKITICRTTSYFWSILTKDWPRTQLVCVHFSSKVCCRIFTVYVFFKNIYSRHFKYCILIFHWLNWNFSMCF